MSMSMIEMLFGLGWELGASAALGYRHIVKNIIWAEVYIVLIMVYPFGCSGVYVATQTLATRSVGRR
jgi:hypothetical protein